MVILKWEVPIIPSSILLLGTIISGKASSLDGGGRQTSFQRCCLHRLADRFGIVRETNEQGMIRLVKVKESAIPSQLLIDLRPSDYEEKQQQSDSDTRTVDQAIRYFHWE